MIYSNAELSQIQDDTEDGLLITLPKKVSDALPSRGMVAVEGTLNNIPFRAILQPNGNLSHWVKIAKNSQKSFHVKAGDVTKLEIETLKDWFEPALLPKDLEAALRADSEANAKWQNITPMARWEWLNWFDTVKQEKTKKERPTKLCSMLKSGKRRPCCFNRAAQMPPSNVELLTT